MRAAMITRPGGPDVLEIREVAAPTPGDTEVVVAVRASALNRADLLQRQGRYPAPPGVPADIPGLELAGEIVECGRAVRGWDVGDRVMAIVGGGAHAELAVVPSETLAAVPPALPWSEAGAVPEAFMTAHDALVTQAGLARGERVLIHAVGSGVGLAAVSLVRALGGIPFGTSRTPEKIDRARAMGLEAGSATASADEIVDAVAGWTGGEGVEIVLDLVGGALFDASLRAAALRGRIMLVGTMGGATAPVALGMVLRRRLTIRGTVLRSRSLEEKAAVTHAFVEGVVPLLASGAVRPVIDRVYPLEDIRAAHERMERNESTGKIVIDVGRRP
jgi:NADPH2:quinone reductase